MRMRSLTSAILALALAIAPIADALARSSGGSSFGSSRSSFSSSSSSSWGRSSSSSTYSKPSTSTYKQPSSSSTYKQPSSSRSVAPARPVTEPARSSTYRQPAAVIGAGAATGAAIGAASAEHNRSNDARSSTYERPSASRDAAKALPAAPKTRTGLDRAIAAKQASEALSAMRGEDRKYTAPRAPASANTIRSNPIASTYASSSASRPTTVVYYRDRDRYYSGLGWQPAPYVYQSSPSFGAWDAMLWWSILDNARDRDRAAMAYHYANDAGYLQFRREAERLAATNAELKAKLDALDETTRSMEGPRDTKYLPPGVKPEVALAADVVTGLKIPELTLATGVANTTYHAVCAGNNDVRGFKAHAEAAMNVKCPHTGGSGENIEGFAFKKYDAILAQADAIDYMLSTGKVKTMGEGQLTAYSETMFLLVRKDSGINSVADLKPNVHTLHVGPKGSGTEFSFRNIQKRASTSSRYWLIFTSTKHNDQYDGIGAKNGSYDDAVSAVANDPKSAMLVLMGGYSPFMQKVEAQFGDRLKLVPLNGDKSFTKIKDKDGNYVYQECTIPGSAYPKLLGAKDVRTLCVQSVLVVSEDWADKNGQTAVDVLRTAWEFTKPDLEKINGGVK